MAVLALFSGCAKKTPEPGVETPRTTEAAPAPGHAPEGDQGIQVEGAAPPAPQESFVFDKKIYFDFDRFDLTSESIATLNELAAYLKTNPGLKVTIEGHCDERGTNEYNLALGERRAKAAYDYLVSQGVDGQRLSRVSYGEERPVDAGHNEEAWAKNRRSEFVLGK